MGDGEKLTELLRILVGEQPPRAELIREGLASNPRCREVAMELAGRDVFEFAPELITLWFVEPARRTAIASALTRDPLLRFESRRPARVGSSEPDTGGPPVQQWFAPARLERILRAFVSASPQPVTDGLALLDRLPGLHQQVAMSPVSTLSEATCRELVQRFEASEARRFPGSITIAPSYECDRNCGYCFVREMKERMGADLELEGFRRALDAVGAGTEVRRVNVFGGEPTQFAGLDAFVRELESRRCTWFFSTIGVCAPARFAQLLASPSLEMVTLHLERPEAYTAEDHRTVMENARALAAAKVQAVIRYNLTDADSRDFEFIRPVLRAVPRAYFSFAVVFPSESRDNQHVPAGDLERFGPKILALVRFLDENFPSLHMVLAKPFPLCAFTPDQLQRLLGRIEYHNICEVHRRGFTDQALINPNLQISPCMALTSPSLAVEEPRSLREIGPVFEERLRGLMAQPPRTRCEKCSLFQVGACQAACYAYLQ